MKRSLSAIAIIVICIIYGCSKEHSPVSNNVSPQASGTGTANMFGGSHARFSGANYSQSIPVDSANRMIQSYLISKSYPAVDSSLRSLSFDADTLRAYLANPSIVTLKFMLAHQPAYINAGGFGKDAGMNPNAMTLIIVGLNGDDQFVKNSTGGVYEHFNPCPAQCGVANVDAYIH